MATFSLSAAGIGFRPPFVRADQVGDAPFFVVHAEVNQNGYGGRPELYAVLELIPTDEHGPVAYDDDGQPVNRVAWTAALIGSREDIARWFAAHPGDQLGPCQFMFVPNRDASKAPFVQLADYVPVSGALAAAQRRAMAPQRAPQRPNAPARPPQPAAARGPVNGRGVVVPDDADLEELPF